MKALRTSLVIAVIASMAILLAGRNANAFVIDEEKTKPALTGSQIQKMRINLAFNGYSALCTEQR
jgi:hypothetical protein